MRNSMEKSWYVIGAALGLALFGASPAAGQTTTTTATTTFNLTSPGSGANLAGVYTSPYDGTIGSSTTAVPVICDDFADESYVPETWTAFVTPLSSLVSGTTNTTLNWLNTVGSTITVDGYSLNQAAAYSVAAVLAVDILAAPVASVQQEDLSYALWGLFDPTGTSGDPGAFSWLTSYGDTTDETNAINDLNAAVKYVEAPVNSLKVQADVNAVTIYSYDTADGVTNCGGCKGPPQEFITVTAMAEPPAPALLGVDLLGLVGLVFVARRYGWLAGRG